MNTIKGRKLTLFIAPFLFAVVLIGAIIVLAVRLNHSQQQISNLNDELTSAQSNDNDSQTQTTSAGNDSSSSSDDYKSLLSAVEEEHDADINSLIFANCGAAQTYPTPVIGGTGALSQPQSYYSTAQGQKTLAYYDCIQTQQDSFIQNFIAKYSIDQ